MAADSARAGKLRLFVLAGGAAVVLLAAGVLTWAWRDRNTIGARVAVDYLRRHGVPATIHLTRLDAGGVEGSIVLGPAGRPTLTAPRFKADFTRSGWIGTPKLSRLQLERPSLAIAFDGRRFDFGALQPLVDEAAPAPKGGGPSPDVTVSNGQLVLATPWGAVRAGVDADLGGGRLSQAALTLPPTTLTLPKGGVDDVGGRVVLRATGGGRYAISGALTARAARSAEVTLRRLQVRLDGEAPQALASGASSPIRAKLSGAAETLDAAGRVSGADVRWSVQVDGNLTGPLATPAFRGRGTAGVWAGRLDAPSVRLVDADVSAKLDALSYAAGAVSARGALGAAARGGRFEAAAAKGELGGLRFAARGQVGAAGGTPPSAELSASANAVAAFDPANASALAARLPPALGQARATLVKAMGRVALSAPAVRLWTHNGVWRIGLPRPLQATTAAGALASVSGNGGWTLQGDGERVAGAGRIAVGGGGLPDVRLVVASAEAAKGAVRARGHGEMSGSLGPAHGARIALDGRLQGRRGDFGLWLDRCAPVSLDTLDGPGGVAAASNVAAQVCPLRAAPLAAIQNSAWTVTAGLSNASLEAPGAKLAVGGLAAQVRMTDDRRGPSGAVQLDTVTVADTGKPARFGAVGASGAIHLSDGRLAGDLAVSLVRPATPLGRLALSADLHHAVGKARLQTPVLAFVPNGLQPAAILPAMASLGSQVQGPVTATLSARWGGKALDTEAHVHVAGVQLKTTAGLVSGVRTDLTLTRLDPLTSALGQHLSAERLAAVLPLTDISATYALNGESLELGGAGATLAGGRITLDPMAIPLKPGGALSGVLRVQGVDLGTVLDALNLSQALSIQAKMAGALPFSFSAAGLRLADGRLAAMGPGRLTFKRKTLAGAVAAGAAANSTMQDFAFQALENLAFTELDARVASRPQGRLGVIFHIRGRHDPPKAEPARVGLFDLLRGRAFDKPLPLPKGTEVNLTLDSSLNLDDLLGFGAGSSVAGSAPVHGH